MKIDPIEAVQETVRVDVVAIEEEEVEVGRGGEEVEGERGSEDESG